VHGRSLLFSWWWLPRYSEYGLRFSQIKKGILDQSEEFDYLDFLKVQLLILKPAFG
jgi:hypothetical protein